MFWLLEKSRPILFAAVRRRERAVGARHRRALWPQLTSSYCVFDTTRKSVSCGDEDVLGFVVVEQPDGGRIGVYVAKSFRVEPNAVVAPSGAYALAIVALDTLDVQGRSNVGADHDDTNSGGFMLNLVRCSSICELRINRDPSSPRRDALRDWISSRTR